MDYDYPWLLPTETNFFNVFIEISSPSINEDLEK